MYQWRRRGHISFRGKEGIDGGGYFLSEFDFDWPTLGTS